MISWQQALREMVTSPRELLQLVALDQQWLEPAEQAARLFKLRATREFIGRIEKSNPLDPLLLQILPLHQETIETPGFSNDPLQESNSNPTPGLLHKYQSRVLLTLTSSCAIHCRFCFRSAFPYKDNTPGRNGLDEILNYLCAQPDVNEVILSGGDPLMCTDALLEEFIQRIAALKHIRRLRIHTRLPIVLPQRITTSLLELLTQTHLQIIVVPHCNHAQEMDDSVATHLALLKQAGITLLNQTVLLRQVNDNLDTLCELQERLFECGVLPYYLHCLDKTQGTAHFDISETWAKQLHEGMQQRLPGFLVPRLVREVPGEKAKVWI